jgi:hypothetical protein
VNSERSIPVESHYGAMILVARASLLLGEARDIVAAGMGAAPAASIGILFDAARGLVGEMGETLFALSRDTSDPERAAAAQAIVKRLREGEPSLAREVDDEADRA